MPSKYFPFDSTFTGVDSNGIPQGDRGATSADWAAYVSRMFTDGYFRLLDGQLVPSISATPMAVDIAAGSAMIKGRQYSQDEVVTVSLGLSDSQPRIDRIVLRMSTEVADRKISLMVLKGTPGASPVAPVLTRTASVYDICLAQIVLGANVVQIVENDLTDTRNDEVLCGYVKILLDGRYYPNGSIPELLWLYTMYPDTLTPEQKAFIEGDTEFMDIYESSNIRQIDIKTIQNKIPTGTLAMFMRNDVPEGFIHANGADLNQVTYADLYQIFKHTYGTMYNFASETGSEVTINGITYLRDPYFKFTPIDIDDGFVYSVETASKITLTTPFTGGDSQNQFGTAIVGDSYYIIGGETVLSGSGTAVTHCRRTKFIDKTTVSAWGVLSTLPIARSQTAVAVYNNKYMYSIGGQASHGNATQFGSGQVQVYRAEILSDGTLSAWTADTALPVGLTWTSAIILGNKIYVLGGVTGPNGMSDPFCVSSIRVATINPETGALSAWSLYGVALPSATNTYQAFKFIAEGKLYALVNNTWYSSDISGEDFSTFTAVSGWTVNSPSNAAFWYRNGYLYDMYYSSGYKLTVRKYENGAFTLVTNAAKLGSRTTFKIPDLRNGAIQFSNTLVAGADATGGGAYNQGAPIVRPIPCFKY